jgi:hypothetical protein
MAAIELWLFMVTDPQNGKRRRTTHRLTIERYIDPEPVEWSREVREVSEQAIGHGQTLGTAVNNWHMCLASNLGIFWIGDTAMAMGRPKAELVLTQAEQSHLQSIARSRSFRRRWWSGRAWCSRARVANRTAQSPSVLASPTPRFRRRDPLERALDCGRDRDLGDQRSSILQALRTAAASQREFQHILCD